MVDLFVRPLIIATIIVAVTDAIAFYLVWSGKAKITPLFVILAIIGTLVPMAINLCSHFQVVWQATFALAHLRC